MKAKSRFNKLLIPFGMLSVFAVASVASSCATIDTNMFRNMTYESVNNNANYDSLAKVNTSFKNAIYGTTTINNGNYFIGIATNSDLNQFEFLHGTKRPSIAGQENSWNGEWGEAIRHLNDPRWFDKTTYPNGIQSLLFNDTFVDENGWNPFAKYPDKSNDETATQEEKNNSNKFRREDVQAKQYRDIVNFVLDTYKTESVPASWYITGSETSETPGKEITKMMVIAFRNKDGKIERKFFESQTGGDNSGDSGEQNQENKPDGNKPQDDTSKPDGNGDQQSQPEDPNQKPASRIVIPNVKFFDSILDFYK